MQGSIHLEHISNVRHDKRASRAARYLGRWLGCFHTGDDNVAQPEHRERERLHAKRLRRGGWVWAACCDLGGGRRKPRRGRRKPRLLPATAGGERQAGGKATAAEVAKKEKKQIRMWEKSAKKKSPPKHEAATQIVPHEGRSLPVLPPTEPWPRP